MLFKRFIKLLLATVVAGLLLYPWTGWAQVTQEQPKAPEAGEVQMTSQAVPTKAAVLGLFKPGVHEVEVRGLDPKQADDAFLSKTNNRLAEIGKELKPGQKVEYRTTDGQRFRVQMTDSGQLRVRLRDVTVQDPKALAAAFSGFGRVEIRGVDANGNRIRYEVRNGVVKKDEVKADHKGRGREGASATMNNERAKDRGKDLDHSLRGTDRARAEHERVERESEHRKAERMERENTRPERMDRSSRPERGERSGRDH